MASVPPFSSRTVLIHNAAGNFANFKQEGSLCELTGATARSFAHVLKSVGNNGGK